MAGGVIPGGHVRGNLVQTPRMMRWSGVLKPTTSGVCGYGQAPQGILARSQAIWVHQIGEPPPLSGSKVDGFVPRTQRVNLRKVGQPEMLTLTMDVSLISSPPPHRSFDLLDISANLTFPT